MTRLLRATVLFLLAAAGLWYLIAGIASLFADSDAPAMPSSIVLGAALLAAAAVLARPRRA